MIKQGYLVTIESYLGDMDSFNTGRFDGLSVEDATWLVRLFNVWKDTAGFSHLCTQEKFYRVVMSVITETGYTFSLLEGDTSEDSIRELAYSVLGRACEYTERIGCAYEIQVYHIAQPLADLSLMLAS